jgi:RHS repeat-associated protein
MNRGAVSQPRVHAGAGVPAQSRSARPTAGAVSLCHSACSGQEASVVYGSYVDEVVAYTQTVAGVTTRYYPHYNHLYSVAALTNAAGQVVERYTYDAYGKQKITDASGNVMRAKSSVGWDRGFTGYVADNETGLLHARARQYSPTLGRFVGRDPIGYRGGGFGLYAGYFVPNRLDPSGMVWQLSNCRRTGIEAKFSLYMVLGFEIGASGSVEVCDCCDTASGRKISDGYLEGAAEAWIDVGAGVGFTVQVPFVGAVDILARGPQFEYRVKLTKSKPCDGKAVTSGGGEFAIRSGVEIGGAFGGGVQLSYFVDGKAGIKGEDDSVKWYASLRGEGRYRLEVFGVFTEGSFGEMPGESKEGVLFSW